MPGSFERTSRADLERELAVDPRSGVLDERSFLAVARATADIATVQGHELALAVIRVPGDADAAAIGETLQRNVRCTDLVGRFEDGAFAILLEASAAGTAAAVARVVACIEQTACVPVAVGVAVQPAGASAAGLEGRARRASSRARRRAGSTVELTVQPVPGRVAPTDPRAPCPGSHPWS